MTRAASHIGMALAVATALTTGFSSAFAQDLKLMDTKDVDPAMLKDMYGTWEIQGAGGRKRCRVVLKSESTIGGSQIDVGKDCAKTFPIMGDIAAWRLYENWTIGFADATRKLRIRFSTPDERYVAEPETDGIKTIVKK
ncbi:AprI/Inh family metalloprotease inhibitor [Tardiphaga alba]|nr:AprI/Inh family metalloprotease inhibitor [Tardiphaga alba]